MRALGLRARRDQELRRTPAATPSGAQEREVLIDHVAWRSGGGRHVAVGEERVEPLAAPRGAETDAHRRAGVAA